MLPVLVVLFLISYGLMSMVIVEQGNTIQHQRYLIGDLLQDSVALSGMKGKALREKALSDPQHKTQNRLAPPTAGAVPTPNAPSAQGSHSHSRTSDKLPPRPASDMADSRRALKSI